VLIWLLERLRVQSVLRGGCRRRNVKAAVLGLLAVKSLVIHGHGAE
jgi:hypothetical protein